MSNTLFEAHLLNEKGIERCRDIGEAFNTLLAHLLTEGVSDARYMALVRTKLEEACFFAKKAVAVLESHQKGSEQ